jgi:hypothetical protein
VLLSSWRYRTLTKNDHQTSAAAGAAAAGGGGDAGASAAVAWLSASQASKRTAAKRKRSDNDAGDEQAQIDADDDEDFRSDAIIVAIVGARVISGVLYCKVRWSNYPQRADSWEEATALEVCLSTCVRPKVADLIFLCVRLAHTTVPEMDGSRHR